jgi:nucleoside-diphosphate-sugar epimerase
MKTTIIGSKGFIGRHLIEYLQNHREEYFAPDRGDSSVYSHSLGNVIYCAGVTSDFRERPFDTVRAHISYLNELLEKGQFNSFLYLSSTRVYFHQSEYSTGEEESTIPVVPHHPEELFNLSKLTGESLCLTVNRPNVRVARISNVCGNDFQSNNFLYSIIKDALLVRKITLRSTLDSAKDYISIDDVVRLLIQISRNGMSKVYNVASGFNISNRDWMEKISTVTGCSIEVVPNANTISFPLIDINRITKEFGYIPSNCIDMTEDLVNQFLKEMK